MRRRDQVGIALMVALALVAAWWAMAPPPADDVVVPVAVAPPVVVPGPPPATPLVRGPEPLVRAQPSEAAREALVRARPSRPVTPVAPDAPGTVVLTITDGAGQPVPEVGLSMTGDCGRRRFSVTDGEGEVSVPPGGCRLVAWRADGALRTFSETVDVEVPPGGRVDAALHLRSERTGGLGVRIVGTGDAIRVLWVLPGSPAEVAGLRAGDLITEVDGTSTSEMTVAEFQGRMTGPVGTDVAFVVSYDDPQRGRVDETVSVTRAYLQG